MFCDPTDFERDDTKTRGGTRCEDIRSYASAYCSDSDWCAYPPAGKGNLGAGGQYEADYPGAEGEVGGSFHIGVLPTIAPYLLPRFFQDMVKKYPKLNITVSEMKTPDIKRALLTGEIDAGILAELNDMEMYNHTHLFYEEFYAYVAREEELSAKSTIKSSELKGEMLWLLDEGHCFRDQMVRFCHINPERNDNLTYQLGSMETFMRMVERGEGITFVPELALDQMSDLQKQLVRPFAIPQPARKIVVLTDKRFIRHSLIDVLQTEIQASIPKSMLKLKPTQVAI